MNHKITPVRNTINGEKMNTIELSTSGKSSWIALFQSIDDAERYLLDIEDAKRYRYIRSRVSARNHGVTMEHTYRAIQFSEHGIPVKFGAYATEADLFDAAIDAATERADTKEKP